MSAPLWRIAHVDDHYVVRAGLASWLDEAGQDPDGPGFVLESFPDVDAFAGAVDGAGRRPDLVVSDYSFERGPTDEAALAAVAATGVPFVVYARATPEIIDTCLAAGALLVLDKNYDNAALIGKIFEVLDGIRTMSPTTAAHAALRVAVTLTPREAEVLDLLKTGMSNAFIAERLGVSPRTVESHVDSVFDKLRNSGALPADNQAGGLREWVRRFGGAALSVTVRDGRRSGPPRRRRG